MNQTTRGACDGLLTRETAIDVPAGSQGPVRLDLSTAAKSIKGVRPFQKRTRKVTLPALLQKGNRKAEFRHGHKGFEVSIARDERRLVIEAALGDKGIGKTRSATASDHFCSE